MTPKSFSLLITTASRSVVVLMCSFTANIRRMAVFCRRPALQRVAPARRQSSGWPTGKCPDADELDWIEMPTAPQSDAILLCEGARSLAQRLGALLVLRLCHVK